MTDPADLVTTTHADGITTITLDDGKANAMSPAMLAAIDGALDAALLHPRPPVDVPVRVPRPDLLHLLLRLRP